jgi:hypothetical protein
MAAVAPKTMLPSAGLFFANPRKELLPTEDVP